MFIWIALLHFSTPSLAAEMRLLSQGAGQVQNQVVTTREVKIGQVVEQALKNKNFQQSKINTEKQTAEFTKQVSAYLLEWAVYLEAKGLSLAPVNAGDVSQAEAKIKLLVKKDPNWLALSPSVNELKSAVERKLRAQKFIDFRAESSVVPITDTDAQRYYEKNRGKFGNVEFAGLRAQIKAFLLKQQVEKRLKDWFEVLQNKYQVRNFFAGA